MPELTVKTFLALSNGQDDIRRFSISTEGTSFSTLLEKVGSTYELTPNSFKLFWKDSDGDSITIANEEDFRAITKDARDNLKLYVKKYSGSGSQQAPMEQQSTGPSSSGAQPEKPPQDPDLHVGITCDGCSKAIRGIRYKCLVCADFDLCADCEGKAMHPDHVVLKVPKPNMPNVTPLILLARALRHANDMAAQGKTTYHNAMGSMPNIPQDFMDVSVLGQQLCTMLNSLGVDASYFVQPPTSRPPFCHSGRPEARSCPCSGNSTDCGASAAAAAAALERRVTETLEHLRAMGFQDDNGSLASLVKSKNGDLFATLDILKAQQNS